MNDNLTDYEFLTTRVGVIDLSDRTLLELKGKDRATFLHNFCTNDVKKLVPGGACEAFITSVQGKTIGHALIFAEAERLLVSTVAGKAAFLLGHFDKYLISEDVTFRDLSADWGQLLAVGPGSREGIPAGNWLAVNSVGIPAAWSCIDRGQLPLTLETLTASDIPTCTHTAWESLRIEQGFPEFGIDFGEDNLPQELRRDAVAISFTKGCYLGQETVARLDAMGHVNQQLSGVRFAAGATPEPGTPLLAGEKVVGKLTSVAWSPKLQAPLGLAILRRTAAAPGAQLIWSGGHAEVVTLPLS